MKKEKDILYFIVYIICAKEAIGTKNDEKPKKKMHVIDCVKGDSCCIDPTE